MEEGIIDLAYLCVCKLRGLAEQHFLVSCGVRVLLVVFKPLYEGNGTLWSQLVAGCVQ